MSIIKLPKKAIDFFKSNQNKIFESGNLAEGPWNEQLSKKIKSICNIKNAICVKWGQSLKKQVIFFAKKIEVL